MTTVPVQSELDTRRYRVVALANALTVLVIQDETTDMASAAMNVNVGHFSDPDELPGLAHFCEHMLFLGTEKYPSENEYSSYLAKNGGSANAFTSMQDTNYHFVVSHAHLHGALDRFAQFFIAPLFSESCTDREVQAVNSEHMKNLQNDFWRMYQLQKSVASSSAHPFSKFGTGNEESLSIVPKSKGINVRDALLKFHQDHYSANRMGLAILGRESLDQLEAWARELFSTVPNKGLAPPTFAGHPLGPEQQQQICYAVPVTDIHSLHIAWPLPDLHPEYRAMPERYISHLIGHEGPNSIFALLKKKGYATGLSAGSSTQGSNVGFTFFDVTIELTPEGIEHHDDVQDIVLAYVRLLRETPVQEWIFRECQQLGDIHFRFKEKTNPASATMALSAKLLTVRHEDILREGSVFLEYQPNRITELINMLRPDNAMVMLISRNFAERVDLKHEKWYGTSYALERLRIKTFDQVGTFDDLKLPEPNAFIPTEFDILCDRLPQDDIANLFPREIFRSPCARLLYRLDDTFRVPKANVMILLRNPLGRASAWAAMQMSLFIELFSDALNAFSYYAEIAHLKYHINEEPEGFQIEVHGYHHKLPLLTTEIAKRLASLAPDIGRFRVLHEKLRRDISNSLYDSPQRLSMLDTNELLHETFYTPAQRLDALNDTTFEQFASFVALALRHMHLDFLVHGNMTQESAIELVQSFQHALNCKAIAPDVNRPPRSLKPERGICAVSERRLHDPDNKNSAIEAYFDVCRDEHVRSRNLLSLVALMLREPLFDQLRTKEQLGYLVSSTMRNQFGSRGLAIYVQSDKPPAFLWARVVAFLDQFKTILVDMSKEDFDRYVQSLVARKREKDKTLLQLTRRYWTEVLGGYYEFDRVETDVAMIETLQRDEIIPFFDQFVRNPSTSARIISARRSHMANVDHSSPTWDTDSVHLITDVSDYRACLELYPVVRPAGHPLRQQLKHL